MLLPSLLSARLAAATTPEETAVLAALPADLRAALAAYEALRIDGLEGHAGREEGDALLRQIRAKGAALKEIEREAVRIAGSGEPVSALTAQLALGMAYEDLANALVAAPAPGGLSGEEEAVYRAATEDMALHPRDTAAAAYSSLLERAFSAGICSDLTRVTHARLARLTDPGAPASEEALPPPPPALAQAYAHLECRDLARAEEGFRQFTASNPGDIASRLGLAATLRLRGRDDEAAALYDALLAEAPGNPYVAFNAVRADLERYRGCPAMAKLGPIEEGTVILEHALPLVEAGEPGLASDLVPLLIDLQAQIDAVKPGCP